MKKVILASHGSFAKGAMDSIEMIIGKQENLKAYELRPGGSAEDFAEEIRAEIEAHPEQEFVILADLYGASVCTAMSLLSIYPNVTVFSGLNLGLALEILTGPQEALTRESIEAVLDAAREGIRHIQMEITEQEEF